MTDPALAHALATARETLTSLQRMQEQTAQLHKQFLDSQEFRTDAITALYTELLGRTPERDGLNFWLNRNFKLEDIREGIMESGEFRGRFGDNSSTGGGGDDGGHS